MKSRKKLAWIVGGIWLTLNLMAVYFLKPDVAYIPVIIISVLAFMFLTAVYIGGIVYKDWIKSAHFQPDLFKLGNKDET